MNRSVSISLFLIISLISMMLGISSCDDYDKWTTSPNAQLSFSVDTVAFDTVIAAMSSPTKTLQVWNNNDEGLHITRVQTQQGAQSHFRVNVDGQYLNNGSGDDFYIRRHDSLYVKIEVLVPSADKDSIQHYEDQLVFTLESGVQQKVILAADGQDVYILRGNTIKKDTTLHAGRPYLIYDSLVVAKDVKLSIEEGVTLMFHDSVSLKVHGTLDAQGTLEKPITFRGDRLDRMFSYLPYDNTTNRWGGIHFYGDSKENVLVQCDVHSGDYGILCDSSYVFDPDVPMLTLYNSIIHNVAGIGLKSQSSNVVVVGTQISNTLGNTVDILGGAYFFVHCTIAQFYPWSADRGYALYLSNNKGTEQKDYYPLHWAHFLNCVITGYADDVIMGSIEESQDYHCDYLFQNCFLRTVVSEDSTRFVSVIYDVEDQKTDPERLVAEKNFKLFDTTNFLYDFTPDSLSRIRGMADIFITSQYGATDRLGHPRVVDGKSDAGAYQYVAPSKK